AEDLRNITEFEIRRDIRQELIRIERIHTRPTVPARSGRNKDHVGILSHRSKSSIGIFEYELSVGVLLPCSEHQPLVGREITHRNSLQFQIGGSSVGLIVDCDRRRSESWITIRSLRHFRRGNYVLSN